MHIGDYAFSARDLFPNLADPRRNMRRELTIQEGRRSRTIGRQDWRTRRGGQERWYVDSSNFNRGETLQLKQCWKISRRQFLSPLALLPIRWPVVVHAAQTSQRLDRQIQPYDFSSLDTFLTPNDKFYIRNHFATPRLSQKGWKLAVTGRVSSALNISYAELSRYPTRNLTVTIECAGNGVGYGGVSTATWTGVSLADVLKKAGLASGVKQVRLIGADQGTESTTSPSRAFARSITLKKALHPDTLLAFQMNGVALPPEHGYPVRAIVPGWYGMDSIKWLYRIEALDDEDMSFYMSERYVAIRLETIGSSRMAITHMQVKSQIARPRDGEVLSPGHHTIHGAAWAGENQVARVEVSTDAGKSWEAATLGKNTELYSWVLWSYEWQVQMTGDYTVVVRATDNQGNIQPAARDPRRFDGYELNWYHSVRCEVR
jgi:DMSO/TMAO reductase YedYZ molybdopterin-dependent catalytic subunit